jgi:RNA polymerase sigma factor (sigma-70 family)
MRLKTKSQTNMRIQIEPLTHRGPTGETYERDPKVKAQIVEALSLGKSDLIKRVAIRDFKAPEYIQEECVVYLIRKFMRDGDEDLVGELMNCLAVRSSTRIHSQVSKSLHREYVDDCCQDVSLEVTRRITGTASDGDDFAQVRFGLWLKRVTSNTLRRYFRNQRQDRLNDSGDDDDENSDRKIESLKDNSPLPDQQVIEVETRKLHEKEAYKLLEKLDPNERNAFLLRHYAGWEIEDQNPSVMTISRYFNRTPRTIRNWLNGASEKLQKWQGGQQ